MKNLLTYLLLGGILLTAACKKDNGEISNVPEIEFVSVAPAQVVEFQDSLVFTISYRDGDGDLGENNPDAKNFYLTDTRNNVTYELRIPQLAPDGATIPIQGNVNATLPNTAITDGSNSQTFSYEIKVEDRAGNMSNEVISASVTVTAQ